MNYKELIFHFEHKGFIGAAKWREEDKCYAGKLMNIGSDLVTFEADEYTGLRQSFREAVYDYINMKLDCL